MVKATCKDYGFDCNFTCEGELDLVITEFCDGLFTACAMDVCNIQYHGHLYVD